MRTFSLHSVTCDESVADTWALFYIKPYIRRRCGILSKAELKHFKRLWPNVTQLTSCYRLAQRQRTEARWVIDSGERFINVASAAAASSLPSSSKTTATSMCGKVLFILTALRGQVLVCIVSRVDCVLMCARPAMHNNIGHILDNIGHIVPRRVTAWHVMISLLFFSACNFI